MKIHKYAFFFRLQSTERVLKKQTNSLVSSSVKKDLTFEIVYFNKSYSNKQRRKQISAFYE